MTNVVLGPVLVECFKCDRKKPLTEFYKNKSRNGNLASWCKLCRREYEKGKRRANASKDKDLTKDYAKICPECGIKKQKSEYYKDRTRNDGLQCYCKVCDMKQRNDRYEKILREWEEIITKREGKLLCQCCGMLLVFPSSGSGKAENVINFDHKTGREVIKSPTAWLRNHHPTKKNIEIWYSCGFGILCWECNFWFGDPKTRKVGKENIKMRLRNMLKNVGNYIGDE